MKTTRRSFFGRLAKAGVAVLALPLASMASTPRTLVSVETGAGSDEDRTSLPDGRTLVQRLRVETRVERYSDGSVIRSGSRDHSSEIVS